MVLDTVFRQNSKESVKILTLPLCPVERTYTDSIASSAERKKVILGSFAAFAVVTVFCMGSNETPLASLPTTDGKFSGRILLGEGNYAEIEQYDSGLQHGEQGRVRLINTASSSSKKFHLTDIIHPETLQPFWFMPISNSLTVMLTVSVFGFSFRSKQPAEANKTKQMVTLVVQRCASLAFIAMALNCWRQDLKKWNEVPGNGLKSSFCVGSVILFTSSNFKASLAIWSKVMWFNPGNLFGKKPAYPHVPCLKLPLSPFEAEWMPPLKWLYAVILLPYVLPLLMIIFIFCCCSVCGKCGVGSAVNGKLCACFCWMMLVIISAGFSSYAKEQFWIYWHDVWPIMYMGYAQGWAFLVAFLVSWIYANHLTGCRYDTKTLFSRALEDNQNSRFGYERLVDTGNLWDIQPSRTKHDFGDDKDIAIDPGDVNQNDVIKMKIRVVSGLLVAQMTVVIQQLVVILTARYILGSGVEGYIEAARKTASERTIKAYMAYLTATAGERLQALWSAL